MTKTFTPSKQEMIKKQRWHFVNASDRVLGDMAVEIAKKLIGKEKAVFTPNINTGDKVVITNAEKIIVTGNKKIAKKYIHYTGYPGGLKTESFEMLSARRPTEILRKAVLGMLPKNKLRKERISCLYIYTGNTHPHAAQKANDGKN